MMESERKIFEMMNKKAAMSKYWMPLVWATNIINRARKEGLITSDHVVQTLLVELSDIRKKLGGLIGYDTVCVPLVYTQVVTLSLYAYFLSALLGRQFISQSEALNGKYEMPDMYFPFFTVLQFCFYVGWLKVAEVLINPFGEDDDDIELNWLIDRHIKAGYMIVDEMHEEHPELLKDQYWNEVVPTDLPYTVASENYRREEPAGSAEHYKVKDSDAVYANLLTGLHVHRANNKAGQMDDVYADYESVDTPLVERKRNWLSRAVSRMGSVRSSSTTYSSGTFFNRNRHNSVYSSPETQPAGGLANGPSSNQTNNTGVKMSLYDRFARRKSIQSQRIRRQGTLPKLNNIPISLKNRPRIPTPDVTKEVVDREQRLALSASNAANIGAGVIGILSPPAYQQTGGIDDFSVLQVVVSNPTVNAASVPILSPIQEKTEGTPVARHQAALPQLAQAVLPQNLKQLTQAPLTAVTAVTVGQLTRFVQAAPLFVANSLKSASLTEPMSLTEVTTPTSGEDDAKESNKDESNSIAKAGKLIVDSYKTSSPILVSPEKLDALTIAGLASNKQPDWSLQNFTPPAATDRRSPQEHHPKSRRSTSLPAPPVTPPTRDDRSNSLPHDLCLQESATARTIKTTTLPTPVKRPRSGSFDQRQAVAVRKISFVGQPVPVAGSKRSEVYV
ncbi:uncharacterized protein LOC131663853 isoform X2 [Phymastichus coffea]|nr:uncharacterized protein LOC131663853 isoform X2 [Phymastichus coffea]